MKALSPYALLTVAALAFAGCHKKTESTEHPLTEQGPASGQTANAETAGGATPGESTGGTAPATSTGAPAAGAAVNAPAAPGAPEAGVDPQADPLLSVLSKEDFARYEAWFKKYNLSFNSAVLDQDTDGDGYTNRQEFEAGTNPRDATSMPGVMEGVSVKQVNEVEVPLILRDVKDDSSSAHVQRSGESGLEEIGQGSEPKGLPYKVTRVKHEIRPDKQGVLNDVSSVTLQNTKTKETVMLVRDLPARSSETNAVLVGADGTELTVHINDEVKLPGQGDKKFKVLDLRSDQVVVEDMTTKKTITIPKR